MGGHEKPQSRRVVVVRRRRGRTDNANFDCSHRDQEIEWWRSLNLRESMLVKKGVSLSSRKPFAVNTDSIAFQLVSQHRF